MVDTDLVDHLVEAALQVHELLAKLRLAAICCTASANIAALTLSSAVSLGSERPVAFWAAAS